MRSMLFVLALLPTAALAGERPVPKVTAMAPPAGKPCKLPSAHYAVQREAAPRAGRLDQQPAANLYLGVMHVVNGCETPIKIAENIGGGTERRR